MMMGGGAAGGAPFPLPPAGPPTTGHMPGPPRPAGGSAPMMNGAMGGALMLPAGARPMGRSAGAVEPGLSHRCRTSATAPWRGPL